MQRKNDLPVENSDNVDLLSDFAAVPEHSRVWLFQALPDWEIKKEMASGRKWWHVTTNFRNVKQGDLAILWQATDSPGIHAIGAIINDPYQMKDQWRVDIEGLYLVPEPISREELTDHIILSKLGNLGYNNAGNPYTVGEDQWKAIYKLLQERDPNNPNPSTLSTGWWWVNQGDSWNKESVGGFVYAVPVPGKRIQHRENIGLLRPGHHLIHYVKGNIMAVGEVTEGPITRGDGREVLVNYNFLENPGLLRGIPLELRKSERYVGAAFDKNGDVNQGYLFPLSESFVDGLAGLSPYIGLSVLIKSIRQKKLTVRTNPEKCAYIVWSILTEVAVKRGETTTQNRLMEVTEAKEVILEKALELIDDYCFANLLPPLTWLVSDTPRKRKLSDYLREIDVNFDEQLIFVFDWASEINPFGYAAEGATEEDLVNSLIQSPDKAREVYALVKVRGKRQSIFRQTLLKIYDGKCAFCQLTQTPALEAAHIIPWREANEDQRLHPSNGLLLCSTHHRLFDAGLMTLNEHYTIEVSDMIEALHPDSMDYKVGGSLRGKTAWIPAQEEHQPSKLYLKRRGKSFPKIVF